MSKYDEAERHAIKELDPGGCLRWQMPDLDPDLEFSTWLETQVSPPPGVPQLRGDCVAGLRSRGGGQAPWACLIEAQAQPLPRMGVWMMVYLGLLHEDLRHGPHDRDRFQMLGFILNLSESPLASTVEWLPPMKQTPAQPERQVGVKCAFWVKNVREDEAAPTLERIARDEVALCVLPWVPVMKGADQAPVLTSWKEQALRQPEPHLRADYVALALVFAELAGREAVWREALKEFDVTDSRIAQEWEDRGRRAGRQEGFAAMRGSVLRVLQARFPSTAIPQSVPPALDRIANLDDLIRLVEEASVTPSLDQFQQKLADALTTGETTPASA